jgi:hypothetical protein
MPDLNPIHYILAGALVLLLILGGMYAWQGQTLKTVQAEYAAFVGENKALGEIAKREKLQKETDLAALSGKHEKELQDAKNSLDRSYAEYDRLRRDKGAGSGRVPSLADAASNLGCGDSEARLVRGLETLEAGILEHLAKPRDEAVNRTLACKNFLVDQQQVLNK